MILILISNSFLCHDFDFDCKSDYSGFSPSLGGSTVNLCSTDVSKAFDTVDHSALFTKLMKRQNPLKLLETLILWLQNCLACMKWKSVLSQFFKLDYGVRQGSVLSPHLFDVYLDDGHQKLSVLNRNQCLSMILYSLHHRYPRCKSY